MVSQKYRWDFIGLSTDEKPTSETSDKVVNGSTYYCSDTSKLYVYCDGAWYERKPLGGGGGGGGTSDFNDLSNRPKYNGSDMTGSTNIPEVKTYTAGSNVAISDQNVISATDTTYSNFTGTDGSSAGTAGLVPAPATTDAGKFLKADGTWGTAGGGLANCKELTAADYNYDSNNDGVNDTVALWLLDPGVYWWNYNFADGGGITFTTSSSGTLTNDKLLPYSQQVIIGYYGNDNSGFYKIQAFSRSGLVQDTYFNWAPFIPYIVNTSNGTVVNFQTNAIPVGRGDGSGPTVVQTTGSSTTDVMSQNAVTSMVYADPSTKYKIHLGVNGSVSGNAATGIGYNIFANGNNAIAIGNNSEAYGTGSIALGVGAKATSTGEVNIGVDAQYTTFGYNNSQYRLLTGLYDPQSDHDAATKGYVDGLATMGTLSASPTGTTVGVPGRLYTYDSGGGTYEVYLCVHDNGDDTYVWKQVSLI